MRYSDPMRRAIRWEAKHLNNPPPIPTPPTPPQFNGSLDDDDGTVWSDLIDAFAGLLNLFS